MVEVSFGRPCLIALCLVNEEGDYKLKIEDGMDTPMPDREVFRSRYLSFLVFSLLDMSMT